MKYGILYNRKNLNIGDDIQAYATAQFLPSVDYLIDREDMTDFRSDNGEPVAVIMNAWYMWNKWNWPPSKYIYPLFVGFHYADHQKSHQPGSPFKYEFLTGEGANYLNAWGPVGTRDYYTHEQLEKVGVESFFSGCITLTIPKQPKKDTGRYICIVDIDKRVAEKIEKQLEGTGIEVRYRSHTRERDDDRSWEEREAFTVERLTEYQNAICVVTKKLHCALPCLAMEVPVLLVKDMKNDIRFTPYYSFLHWVRPGDFLKGKCDYDFTNPPPNKPDYKPVREDMIRRCKEFVASVKDDNRSVEEVNRYGASEETVLRWRVDAVKKGIELYEKTLRDNARKYADYQLEYWQLLKDIGGYNKKYGLVRRLKHKYYIKKDATYRNFVPKFDLIRENNEAAYAALGIPEPQTEIEKLREQDLKQRMYCKRLRRYSKRDFHVLNGCKELIKKLKKTKGLQEDGTYNWGNLPTARSVMKQVSDSDTSENEVNI